MHAQSATLDDEVFERRRHLKAAYELMSQIDGPNQQLAALNPVATRSTANGENVFVSNACKAFLRVLKLFIFISFSKQD